MWLSSASQNEKGLLIPPTDLCRNDEMIAPAGMNNQRLDELIQGVANKIHEAQLGYWKFEVAEMLVLVVTDQVHNRMRIMAPIADVDSVPSDEWLVLLSANFDKALDARYCVNGETLWSAFIHPLKELSSQQVLEAMSQVITLAKNYGTSYSSSNLAFGG